MSLKSALSVLIPGVSLLLSSSSYALPLLAESAGQNVANQLTLYPDSENPNLFYYMPNASEFALDPTSKLPEFGLTYWGIDGATPTPDAGAFMTFSVRLTSDADQTAALQAALQSGKQISVLPIEDSMVGLSANSMKTNNASALSSLFSEFDFAPHAGLAEDDIGVNATLTPIGARVFKTAIENPQALKLDYCYKVQGLGPNFDASIDIRWDRVYEDFQEHASGGGWWWSAEIDTEIEKLRQNNAITIHIDGGNASDEEYVKAVADKIVARLFTVELPDQAVSNAGGPSWGFVRAQIKYTNISEFKEETWQLVRRDLVERNFCLDLGLENLSQYKDSVVKDADKN